MRTKTWTALNRKSETFSVFDGAERAERDLDPLCVIPADVAGPYLLRYAQEAAWREDLRRVSNGEQADGVVGLAMACPPSIDFCGYWQRAHAA
jgi:hypothetical protein